MIVTPALIREQVLDMITKTGASHIGACFSIVDILWVLYFKCLRVNPENPLCNERDIFLLSKAHASAALYAVLAYKGFFSLERLQQYYIDNGFLPGHLDKSIPGVEASLGSLGHGLAIGVGMALARYQENKGAQVFVLIGDGECNEGSIWEAAMIAGHLELPNLTVIIDFNKIQSLGHMKEVIDQSNLAERWRSFGWNALEVDGHDVLALELALKWESKKPKAIIAHTIKGKGVSFMEHQLAWHYKSPNPEEYAQAIQEIQKI